MHTKGFTYLALVIVLSGLLINGSIIGPDYACAFDLNDLGVNFDKQKIKNLPKQVTKFAPVTFEVPLDLADIPTNFRGADLVVRCLAESSPPGIVAGWKTKKGLLNGSAYQGKVSVPGNEVYGMISDQIRGFCIAFAKKDNTCLVLGAGCNSGSCGGPFSGQVKCEPLINNLMLENRLIN